MADKIKFALALVLLVAGVVGFYLLSEQAMVLRSVPVGFDCLAFALPLPGRPSRAAFWYFRQRNRPLTKTKKVVWPSRKGNIPDHRDRLCLRRDHGPSFFGLRTRPRVGSLRFDSGLEEIMSKRWYVVPHAYSGFEKSVQRALSSVSRVMVCKTCLVRFSFPSKRSSK